MASHWAPLSFALDSGNVSLIAAILNEAQRVLFCRFFGAEPLVDNLFSRAFLRKGQ